MNFDSYQCSHCLHHFAVSAVFRWLVHSRCLDCLPLHQSVGCLDLGQQSNKINKKISNTKLINIWHAFVTWYISNLIQITISLTRLFSCLRKCLPFFVVILLGSIISGFATQFRHTLNRCFLVRWSKRRKQRAHVCDVICSLTLITKMLSRFLSELMSRRVPGARTCFLILNGEFGGTSPAAPA